ncbi:MAG: hypothetical protein ACI97A_001678 [Planctomycetota bacterium]|jgi:hypothetical protein
MSKLEQNILPGVGLGKLTLGTSEEEVLALMGEPSNKGDIDYGDGVTIHMWEFEDDEISITFAEDDEFRLGSITTGLDTATLMGLPIIAQSEEEMLKCKFGDLGTPELEEDAGDSGKDYCWDEANLSCWVADDHVISVSIMPLYDESGDIPVWPTRS